MVATALEMKLRSAQLFVRPETSKQKQLFELYAVNKSVTDEEAATAIYSNAANGRLAFVKLKHELKKTLRRALLSIDSRIRYNDKNTFRLEIYIDCLNEVSLMYFLRNSNKPLAAAEVGERLLSKALKNEFTDIALRVTKTLARFHSTKTHDAVKSRYFTSLHDKLLDTFYWESRSNVALSEIAQTATRGLGAKPELVEQTQKRVDELLPQLSRFDNKNLNTDIRMVIVVHYMNSQRWEEAAQACREAIEFFKSSDDLKRIEGSVFFSNLIISLSHLRQFSEARQLAVEQMLTLRIGTNHWVTAKGAYAMMCFRSGDFDAAQNTVLEIRQTSQWEQMLPNLREIWHVFEAWLFILHHAGHLEELKFEFRRGRFLNQVPEYSKDKRGMNINLILVQILFLLQEGRWEALNERFEALGKYNYRMVRKAGQLRSFHFIRMALAIPKARFQKVKVMRLAARFMPLVSRNPALFSEEKQDLEIIEFEKIWEIMREMLPEKPAQLRKAA